LVAKGSERKLTDFRYAQPSSRAREFYVASVWCGQVVMGESFRVGIVGCGYVGPVTAACLAHLGHRVVCVDKDEGKLAGLRSGGCPSTSRASRSGSWMGELRRQRLRFSSDLSGALKGAQALFISVESARGGEWAGRSMR
jgi:UDP-N-acetyl-D-mannosaminuronate dehydrogenase